MIICENDTYKEAAEFYAAKLGLDESAVIAIVLHPKMQYAGYCEYHDDDVLPYCIVGLDVNDGPEDEDPLAVLAHEMVHAKQYFKGELVDRGKYCSWHGKDYTESEAGTEDYYFSPWEVEAYGMQVGLYRMYLRSTEE